MASRTSKFLPATRSRLCPVCEGNHKCSITEDKAIFCGRQTGDVPGFVCLGPAKENPIWTIYRAEEEKRSDDIRRNGKQSPPSIDWPARNREYVANLTPEAKADLADNLGLPDEALESLAIGYIPDDPHGPCWTFPEVNSAGVIVGVSRRWANDEKKAANGSNRGLTLPRGWQQRSGPIVIVEGASDVLALTSLGVAAIGRPSNTGGVTALAELLADVPGNREIVVMVENDLRPDGTWPGEASKRAAEELTKRLGRTVTWALTPDGVKDARRWYAANVGDLSDLTEVGKQFLAAVQAKRDPYAFRWEPISSATLATDNYRPSWLVVKAVVAMQPMIFGGPNKSLKTSIVADLAVSLASGKPWLGWFPVPEKKRVAFISGESGAFTLQNTAQRICAARGIDLADLGDDLLWLLTVPKLSSLDDLAALGDGIAKSGVKFVAVDPMYLALMAGSLGVKTENLFEMGPMMLRFAQTCLDAGATPALVHHTNKATSFKYDPLELSDLAYGGSAEFARQWCLINRREPMDKMDRGLFKLWMTIGGSVGHSGLFGVDVNQGQLGDDFGGRVWDVTINEGSDIRQSEKESKADAKKIERMKADAEDDAALMRALIALAMPGETAGYGAVMSNAHLPRERMKRSYERLLAAKAVAEGTVFSTIANGGKKANPGIIRLADSEGEL